MQTSVRHEPVAEDDFRRPPEVVMRLQRMGSFHQTRLSFMRVLLRRLKLENWRYCRKHWAINEQGFGHAVYTVTGPHRSYSLVAFSHELPDHLRSDRVIATAWDATFALFDGIPSSEDIDRLKDNVPKQEAGRISDRELSLSRANRSVRLWNHVVDCLAKGEQPDIDQIESVGYLMRTTAVYGSGKFGAADRLAICDRDEMKTPFQAEMLSVWLTRAFAADIVEHIARGRGGEQAAKVEPRLRRRLGVGNSTGLGMAPFLVNHPTLLNNWIAAREEAIARVRSLSVANRSSIDEFKTVLEKARLEISQWRSVHEIQVRKLAELGVDIDAIQNYCQTQDLVKNHPWDRLVQWSESHLSLEGQELLASMILEPHGDLVDGLSQCMHADELRSFFIDGSMSVEDLKDILAKQCHWATEIDYFDRSNSARFWYTSTEKLEPRLGDRFEEAGASNELPLSIGRYIKSLNGDLEKWQHDVLIADFLIAHPEHRHTVRRVQNLARHPYSEIQDNLISSDLLPIDLLRCKLSFFGATKFDPRSDRWVRICMYQDAPYPHEILESVR